MSEYLFLLGYGHLGKRAEKIAGKHGVDLINYYDPGCRCKNGGCRNHCPATARHWFTGPNRGEPFNSKLAAAVAADLNAAGITTASHRKEPPCARM